jgi:hypothetical protein
MKIVSSSMQKASCINKVLISEKQFQNQPKCVLYYNTARTSNVNLSSHYEPRTGNRDSCPMVKWSKHEAYPPPSPHADVKNEQSYTFTPPYIYTGCA